LATVIVVARELVAMLVFVAPEATAARMIRARKVSG
jgi:hypothetical protein